MKDASLPHGDVLAAEPEVTDETLPKVDPLVAEHLPFVWRLLRRLGLTSADADDAAQQVFMIAARKLDKIAPQQARAFLAGVSLRVARNLRRGIQRRREEIGEPPEAASEYGPERFAELGRARELLDELLAKLPDDLRRALVLVEIEQFEVAEVAELEGIPVGTAASRLRRARAAFRAALARAQTRNPFGDDS